MKMLMKFVCLIFVAALAGCAQPAGVKSAADAPYVKMACSESPIRGILLNDCRTTGWTFRNPGYGNENMLMYNFTGSYVDTISFIRATYLQNSVVGADNYRPIRNGHKVLTDFSNTTNPSNLSTGGYPVSNLSTQEFELGSNLVRLQIFDIEGSTYKHGFRAAIGDLHPTWGSKVQSFQVYVNGYLKEGGRLSEQQVKSIISGLTFVKPSVPK